MNEQQTYDWKDKTILIVEDNDNNFDLLKTYLKNTHSEIIWAKDGDEAVTSCRENPAIDLVLMDIQLPTVSGFDATKQIRLFNPELPILAQTAFAMIGDREKSIQAGCNDYLSKPIRRKDLLSKVAEYL